MVMHNNHEESIKAVTKMSLQFLAEAIGQCPAGLESSTNRDIVFAVLGFQYGAVQSAAYVAGLDEAASAGIAEDVVSRINGMNRERVSRPGEFHPQPLAELHGSLSAHIAPIIQPSRYTPLSNAQMSLDSLPPEVAAFCLLWFSSSSIACTFSSSSVPSNSSCVAIPVPLLNHKIACSSSSIPSVSG